jgi:hypothetical protein
VNESIKNVKVVVSSFQTRTLPDYRLFILEWLARNSFNMQYGKFPLFTWNELVRVQMLGYL